MKWSWGCSRHCFAATRIWIWAWSMGRVLRVGDEHAYTQELSDKGLLMHE